MVLISAVIEYSLKSTMYQIKLHCVERIILLPDSMHQKEGQVTKL